MADKGYVRAVLGAIKDGKRELNAAFEHVLDTWRLGPPEHQTRAQNAQLYFLTSTSAAASTSEFSIEHGLATTPKLAIPVLDLTQVGCKAGGLTVSRAADGRRVYLKSSDTSTVHWLLIE